MPALALFNMLLLYGCLISLEAFKGYSGCIEICWQKNVSIPCFSLVTLVMPGDILENNVMKLRD